MYPRQIPKLKALSRAVWSKKSIQKACEYPIWVALTSYGIAASSSTEKVPLKTFLTILNNFRSTTLTLVFSKLDMANAARDIAEPLSWVITNKCFLLGLGFTETIPSWPVSKSSFSLFESGSVSPSESGWWASKDNSKWWFRRSGSGGIRLSGAWQSSLRNDRVMNPFQLIQAKAYFCVESCKSDTGITETSNGVIITKVGTSIFSAQQRAR